MATPIDKLITSNNIVSNASSIDSSINHNQILNRRTQFLELLNKWHSTPSLPHLWIITFDIPNLLNDSNMVQWGEKLSQDDWGVDSSLDKLVYPFENTQLITGCMFAQEVEIPGEWTKVEYRGVENRGFVKGPVMINRFEPYYFSIKLFESNSSFTDSIIRPWVILSAHYGLVARPNNETIKSNLTIYELAKTGNGESDLIPRKEWHFYNCFPNRVLPHTVKYSTDQGITVRDTLWNYTRYQLVQNN